MSVVPKENDYVYTDKQMLQLGNRISGGGEGNIYDLGDGRVCKIYNAENLTNEKHQKLKLMLRKNINRHDICWPTEIVYDRQKNFVGYIMKRALGKPMQFILFSKPRLEKAHPHWNRKHLVKIALNILSKIKYLHKQNIIIGDINPLNIMINTENDIYFVDTDSYQIENFRCPVGTVNFTPPELQGKNYSQTPRTFQHEYFAVATLLFMILLPGKPPYSQQGGGSPLENIRSMNFPYPFGDAERLGRAPTGPWQFIWSHLPFKVKKAFYESFTKMQRHTIKTWLDIMRGYEYALQNDRSTLEIFPKNHKIVDPVDAVCGLCNKHETTNKKHLKNLLSRGKEYWCNDCKKQKRVDAIIRQHEEEQKIRAKKFAPKQTYRPTRNPGYQPLSHKPNRSYTSVQKTQGGFFDRMRGDETHMGMTTVWGTITIVACTLLCAFIFDNIANEARYRTSFRFSLPAPLNLINGFIIALAVNLLPLKKMRNSGNLYAIDLNLIGVGFFIGVVSFFITVVLYAGPELILRSQNLSQSIFTACVVSLSIYGRSPIAIVARIFVAIGFLAFAILIFFLSAMADS